MSTPSPEVRVSADGALAVRNAPTRYRADGQLAPWSVVYAPPRSGYDSPVALTDLEASYGWTALIPAPATLGAGPAAGVVADGPLDDAPRAVWPPYDRYRPATGRPGDWAADREAALHDALYGVRLGAYDRRIVTWLAGWDIPTVATVCSLLRRAHAAGRATTGGAR